MACADYRDRIDDLVDGTLDAAAVRELEAHLATCASCARRAADLRAIRATARALERHLPPPGAWAAIASRIEADAARRARFGTLGWLAAAAVLVIVSTSVIFLLLERPDVSRSAAVPAGSPAATAPAEPAGNADSAALVESIESELTLAERHYENAIAGLEKIAKEQQATLDPQVAATLQKNLGVIDGAIEESRAALESQPNSLPAQQSLFEALRRKVGLLQDTIALVNEMRKGNQAGAARIVEGLNKS
jgi:hypothetical protein